jgi:hypothetical protein
MPERAVTRRGWSDTTGPAPPGHHGYIWELFVALQ